MTTVNQDTVAPPAIAMDEARILDVARSNLRAALAAAPWPRVLTDVATDVLAEPTRALGGRLTPWILFPLYCCAATCGDWAPALPAATAAELYITALDLCDDIEDGDLSPAVERYGAPMTLNLATALLALAHEVLKPADTATATTGAACRAAQDALWQGLAVATGGQHMDLAAAGAAPLTVEECLDIARRKGGALAEACCRAGASFGTDDPALIERCGTFGRSLGLIGQLDNDMHDADDSVGKSDLARHSQTVPIASARALGGSGELGAAVWQGGIQLAYALIHAERVRAREELDSVVALCPDPVLARIVLESLLEPRGPGSAGT